ncbi:DUF4160 domain-containing protein [Bifidobacterium breve]|uniref:DUF4160 domain-containing protein n=1 Tax=Bifidobacterium breve TaxID=1685 RepID=UPI00030FB585|nr:DUF4160 domain-containing protein [Bifidobacterium breve]OPG86937.1 hypothetical protein B5D08_03050 [Bifidobacterium breve]
MLRSGRASPDYPEAGTAHASFTFDGNLLKGDLPRKQRKLVEAWVLLHAEELEADWELAFNLEHPFRIDPLR